MELPRHLLAGLQNALELARYGRLTAPGRRPFTVEHREPAYSLRRYAAATDAAVERPVLLLVPPLGVKAEVWDVGPERSAVGFLLERAIDAWLVDFGAPEQQPGGAERKLEDHVLAVDRAIDHVRKATGRDVHLAGYSQGGIFCYLAASYRDCEGIASLISFGSPVDTKRALLPGLPDDVAAGLIDRLAQGVRSVFDSRGLPAWAVRGTFQLITPAKTLRSRIDFLKSLHDRERLARGEAQRVFVQDEAWVTWPGPALRDFAEQFLAQNRLLRGGLVIGGRPVSLADLSCPVLAMIGTTDEIARAPGIHALAEAAPRAELFHASVRAGHLGLVVSGKAMQETWPLVADWLFWREGRGERPPGLEDASTRESVPSPASASALALEIGVEAAQWALGSLRESARSLQSIVTSAFDQLPRFARLEGSRGRAQVSLARSLAEQAAEAPERTAILFEGRAHTYAEVQRSVDRNARGLLAAGVRQGERVGIWMESGPAALGATAAASRIGACAVLLRPEGDFERELRLGEIDHLVVDREHLRAGRERFPERVLLHAPDAEPEAGVRELASLAAEDAALPGWYAPDQGRAEEVAFVLFTGQGEATRATRITNRRWALAALGAASATALTPKDTVYCWTPIHHPTGLLVSMSAALVSGARFAVSQGFSAASFWEEARRYGASVVFYAGTMCRELVEAPPDPRELHHPVRVFAGSGMPRPLWQRLVDRFPSIGVVELYASSEGTAILANVSGAKLGSVGRPIPGSAEVALASFDLQDGTLLRNAAGFAMAAETGAPGLLLARSEPEQETLGTRPQRGVFERGDAWTATGDLFRCDADGDYWLVDHVADLISTPSRRVPSLAIEEAIWALDAVSAAAVYGLPRPDSAFERPVAAVMLRPGERLDHETLGAAVAALPPESRPALVSVVAQIPLTAGYRFDKRALRAGAQKGERRRGSVLAYDRETGTYREVDAGKGE